MDPTLLGLVLTAAALIAGGVGAYYTWRQYHLSRKQTLLEPTYNQLSPPHPGLNQITDIISLTEEDTQDTNESVYREWLADETGFIDIRGIAGKSSISAMRFEILALYTALYVQKGLTNWDLDQGNIRGTQRIPLTEIINSSRCVAIIGDPGSGKTTFLRYIARKQLNDPQKPLPVIIMLSDVYQYALSKSINQPHPSFQSDSDGKLKLTLDVFLDFLIDLNEKEKLELTRIGCEKKIQNGEILWLLDSLDELPSSGARETMVQAITGAARRWKSCKFVLTSRPIAMTGKAIPFGFEVVGIEPMQNEEIRLFLETWTALLFAELNKHKQQDYCDKIYSLITDNSQLRILARNPVMLTCMAVLYYNTKHLPEGRANLLEAVIHWLIHAKERALRPGHEQSKFIEERYREIALAMFEAAGGRKNRIGRRWAASKIAYSFERGEEAALQFLSREENETGLIVRRGEGDLAFWHIWFQEYLAAMEIAGKTDEENIGWWSKIRDRLDDIEWREVLSLVPACLYRLGSDRVDLFFERLSKSCIGIKFATKLRRIGLGGRILRDLLVIGYKPVNVQSWQHVLNDVVPILKTPDKNTKLEERYEALVAYGLGGDDRLINFDKTWSFLRGGVFYMGAQSDDSSSLNYDSDAAPWESPVTKVNISDYEFRKYPVTVEEYKLFISDDGYVTRDYWTDNAWNWCSENDIKTPGDWEDQLLFPNCPITAISWFEAIAYCQWLTLKNSSGYIFRLPSETEWEYAVRRGIPSGQRFGWGNILKEGDNAEANWAGCNLRKKSPIGMFPESNTVDGLTDMIGNVEEWCADSWSPSHIGYPEDGTPRVDQYEHRKVVRGGSTIRYLRLCRPTYRSRTSIVKRYHTIGFRPVRIKIT